MNNGYYSTTGAMVTQFNKLDVISNNLANVNTTAFKQNDVVIGDFKRIFQEYQDEMPIKDHTKSAAKFLNRSIDRVPQISEEYIKYAQNGLKKTDNTFDFALKRADAFFAVRTPNGVRLTQNGSFTLDKNGVLVTKEGYEVLPASYKTNPKAKISIEENQRINVDKNGIIYADGVENNQFYLVRPTDIRRLEKQGDSLFTYKDEKELITLNDDDVIAQGYLETSNVNAVSQMTGLIEASRMVEMYQKVMTTHMNDLNNEAINKLATTKA